MFIYYAWSFLSWVGCNDFFLNLTRWWSTPSTLETTPEGEGSTSSSSMPRWYEMISVPMVLWSWYCTKRWKSWRWLASHRTRARVSIFKLLPSFTLLRSFKFWSFWCSSLVYYHPRQRLMFPIEHPLVQANIRGRLQKSRLQEDDLIDMTQRILNACLVWRFSSCCLVVLIFDVCRICQNCVWWKQKMRPRKQRPRWPLKHWNMMKQLKVWIRMKQKLHVFKQHHSHPGQGGSFCGGTQLRWGAFEAGVKPKAATCTLVCLVRFFFDPLSLIFKMLFLIHHHRLRACAFTKHMGSNLASWICHRVSKGWALQNMCRALLPGGSSSKWALTGTWQDWDGLNWC